MVVVNWGATEDSRGGGQPKREAFSASGGIGLTLIVRDEQRLAILSVLFLLLVTQRNPTHPSKCHSKVRAPRKPFALADDGVPF